jgi:hypothetical protein
MLKKFSGDVEIVVGISVKNVFSSKSIEALQFIDSGPPYRRVPFTKP